MSMPIVSSSSIIMKKMAALRGFHTTSARQWWSYPSIKRNFAAARSYKSIVPQNVEIKARVRDPENLAAIVYDLTESLGSILKQEDTFFNVQNGRLKLRVLKNKNHGELIYYERPDQGGPKCSEFYSSYIAEAATFKHDFTELSQLFEQWYPACQTFATDLYENMRSTPPVSNMQEKDKAIRILGTVKKCRRLYMYGTTRIHLDEVAGLGLGLELKVVLQPGQTSEDGEKIAKELMAQLGVEDTDLIAVSYMDMLIQGLHPMPDQAPPTFHVPPTFALKNGINYQQRRSYANGAGGPPPPPPQQPQQPPPPPPPPREEVEVARSSRIRSDRDFNYTAVIIVILIASSIAATFVHRRQQQQQQQQQQQLLLLGKKKPLKVPKNKDQ